MEFRRIESDVIEILQEQRGNYQLAYQIFKKIEQNNPELAEALLGEYPTEQGNPPMGENAGTYYSVATFIAHALNYFEGSNLNIRKAFLLSENLRIEEIEAGNPEGLSIWAWENQQD